MKAIARYIDDAITTGRAKNDADIARQCGVSRPTVSRWRSGDRTPDDDEAVKLAELLGIEAGEVLAECGAARAKTPETRRAWERIAARMAASSITACAMIIAIGQSQEASAYQAMPINNLNPVIFRSRLLNLIRQILKQFRDLNAQGRGQLDHRIGWHPAALRDVAIQG